MYRSGSKEIYQDWRANKEAPSSRVSIGGQKVLEAGDDGSGWCGICSACISVRGMLDCCSHEYCFDCIENWSSVSNQCPLCKLQFRFISVENVYEENIVEKDRPFVAKQGREEEPWNSEAALPFAFPSFFIDEDAVACLEGRKCLVRAGVPLPDEDAVDTSVACDSCDRWYHAGCVGFDPSISWGSWLCPRCSSKAAANKSQQSTASFPTVLPLTSVVSSSTSVRVAGAELASYATVLSEYDRSTSISVVGKEEPTSVLSICRAVESSVLPDPNAEIKQASIVTDGNCSDARGQASIVFKTEEVVYPPSEDKASKIQTSLPSAPEKLDIEGQKPVDAPSVSSISKSITNDSSRADFDLIERMPKKAARSLTAPVASSKAEQGDLAVVLLQGSYVLESEARSDKDRNESKIELEVAESADLPASCFDDLDFAEQSVKEKRNQRTRQDRDFVCAEGLPEPHRKLARSTVKKKEAVRASTSRVSSKTPGVDSPKMDSQAFLKKDTSTALQKQVDGSIPYTENVLLEDVVHMVKDERAVDTGLVKDKLIGCVGSHFSGGVRTRVVMRRDSDGRTAQIVKDIRQQMRSAAAYGATDDHGKMEVSGDRFFAAYKAAMVRTNEKSQSVKSQSLKRRRNSWLDKMLDRAPSGKAGGIRESLTKKLYTGGVSRKTWDRDWDVSFWKEHSARMKKAKQEASDNLEGRAGVGLGELPRDGNVEEAVVKKFKKVDVKEECLLSRLYVADTSLFPRNNDIKPLYLLVDVKDEGKTRCLGGGKATSESKSLPKSLTSMDFNFTVTKPPLPSRAGDASTNGTANPLLYVWKAPCDTSDKIDKSAVKDSGLLSTHKHVDASGIVKASSVPDPDEKKDKRQWAREVLARKFGDVIALSPAKGYGESKKESSLLGQVPEELRPTLPPDRRSRVPTAVRQSQLNRILEHYLRKARLTSLQGGYKLKSLISLAVAKELEIHDSSNSKGVYVNLCVRALAEQDEIRFQVSIPQPAGPDAAAAVTEALVSTGLISDSPPGSICEIHKSSKEIAKALSRNRAPEEVSKAEDVEDELDLSITASFDVYRDMNIDFEANSCDESIARVPRPIVSSKNKMKVVLTSSRTISSSQVPHKNLEESSTGRENDVGANESKTNAKAGIASADHESGSFVSAQSTSIQEDKNADAAAKPAAFMNGRKTKISSVAKAGKEYSAVPGEDETGGQYSKKFESECTFVACPVRSNGESEGDDWINTCTFPDLEGHIDKINSQINEEHVFGGSLQKLTSVDEVRLGRAAKPSSIPDRKGNCSNPGGKEASSSVKKQVEAYVKEHLKPLYTSGVVKSDQFRFAVSKTASKVMQYHRDAISADFLIVEGSKVKKVADQYLQSYVQNK